MICKSCGKKITPDMEIEYSMHFCEFFCCPDCAVSYYMDQAISRPVDYEEALEIARENGRIEEGESD